MIDLITQVIHMALFLTGFVGLMIAGNLIATYIERKLENNHD